MNNQIEEIELLGCREALQAIEKADQMVSALCQGSEKWIMQIPARPDKDPDLVISRALHLAKKALEARTPSISYADALEKVSVAIIQRDIKGCGGEIMDRGKELAKAALAAMEIEEGEDG